MPNLRKWVGKCMIDPKNGRRMLLVLTFFFFVGCAQNGELPPEIVLVDRFVNAKVQLSRHPASHRANQDANEALHALIQDESLSGDRALAVLAGHYLGDAREPECELLRRGERMIPLLLECDRVGKSVGLPRSNTYSRLAIAEMIENGERCE